MSQSPMDRKAIDEKIAKHEAKKAKWSSIADLVRLIVLWPLLGTLSLRMVLEVYNITVQDMDQLEKLIWITTQNFHIFAAWVFVFYAIRHINKRQGW